MIRSRHANHGGVTIMVRHLDHNTARHQSDDQQSHQAVFTVGLHCIPNKEHVQQSGIGRGVIDSSFTVEMSLADSG